MKIIILHIITTLQSTIKSSTLDCKKARLMRSFVKICSMIYCLEDKEAAGEQTAGERGQRSIFGTLGRRNILQAAAD